MESPNSRRKVKRAARQAEVFRLRIQGMTQPEIAKELGCDHATVSRDLSEAFAAFKAQLASEAEHFARLDLARLEALINAVMPAALDGDVKSVTCVKSLLERRARMLGLDHVPTTKLELVNPDTDALRKELTELLSPKPPEALDRP